MDHDHFYDQVRALQARAADDPSGAGLEALRLLEDLFYDAARARGYGNEHGGLADYTNYLRARNFLTKDQHARARRYTDVRNCLAHRSGLLMSAGLTEEVLEFLETLVKGRALSAEQLMSRPVRTIGPSDPLLSARDWMLEKGVSQLPVLDGERVVGLLTNRDLLMIEGAARSGKGTMSTMTVAEALHADPSERLRYLPPEASYDEVLTALQQHFTALLITAGGDQESPLLGIITVNDLLPKL